MRTLLLYVIIACFSYNANIPRFIFLRPIFFGYSLKGNVAAGRKTYGGCRYLASYPENRGNGVAMFGGQVYYESLGGLAGFQLAVAKEVDR